MDDARLIALLAKKRSPIKAGLVDAVMAQPVPDEDKAQRIEMIDLLPDVLPRPGPPKPHVPKPPLVRLSKARPVRAAPPPLVNPDLDEADRVEHRRRHLGRPPAMGGLWGYLFLERRRMAEWGARTSTLERGTFPFTLKLTPEALQFAVAALRNEILPVLEQNLPKFLGKAWKSLEKYDYNLLAALKNLCQKLSSVSPSGPKGPVAAQWEAVIPAVMVFWTEEGLLRRTTDAWNMACGKLGATENVRLGGQDSIRTLLEARSDRVALPDFLRALLMLRTRRALEWDELLPREHGEYFSRDAFDCTPDLQAEIDRTVTLLRQQLEPIDRDFVEVRRIRFFLPAGRVLEEFDRGQNREDRSAWCLKFLELAEPMRPLLSGTVALQGGETATLFSDIPMNSALTRLGVLHTQLAGSEGRDPELTASVARVITNLGKLIVLQIRNRSLAADPLVRHPRPEEVADPLPHELKVLERPTEWAGLSVIDALVKTARICLLAGRFLGDTSLEAALEREEPLRSRAHEIVAQLVRLAKPSAVTDVAASWAAYLPDLRLRPSDAVPVSV